MAPTAHIHLALTAMETEIRTAPIWTTAATPTRTATRTATTRERAAPLSATQRRCRGHQPWCPPQPWCPHIQPRREQRRNPLNAVIRAMLASGQLGRHHGLPVSIIVTARLPDLQTRTGTALTGGGTVLPISDVIRLARHAHHYLTPFDQAGRPRWLGHTKRLATTEQRLVLHATDRGCSAPGCDVPATAARSTTSRNGPKPTAPTSTT